MDVIYTLLAVAFWAALVGMARGCAHLGGAEQ